MKSTDRTFEDRLQYMEAIIRILANGPRTIKQLHSDLGKQGKTAVKKDAVGNDAKILQAEGAVDNDMGIPMKWSLKMSVAEAMEVVNTLRQGMSQDVPKAPERRAAPLNDFEMNVVSIVSKREGITGPEVVKILHPRGHDKKEKEKVFKALLNVFKAGKVTRSKVRPFRYGVTNGVLRNTGKDVKAEVERALQADMTAGVRSESPRSKPAIGHTAENVALSEAKLMSEAEKWRDVMTRAVEENDATTAAFAKKFLAKLAVSL
jgi:hypothetical protein